jgi:Lon protease-like protein
MCAEVSRDFPLFPLGIVALPGEGVPLHVFEDRYRRMIEHCLAAARGSDGREFGIVWLSDDGLREVGCACAIDRVLEQLDDGRMNLLVRGTRPFRVLERQGHLPYPAGVIEFVEDREDSVDPELVKSAHEAYAELVKRATDREPDPDELAEMSAYAMAATVDFGLDAKQGLLDMRSENGRLRLVTRLFRAAIKRLELVDRVQERARSNGKVRFGAS